MRALIVIAILVLTQFSSQLTAQTVSPTFADVKYGPYERNVLDFYQAESKIPTPVAVYIHGGGFRQGDKKNIHRWYAAVLDSCLANGISVAAIHYRFIKDATLPDIFLELFDRRLRKWFAFRQFTDYHSKTYHPLLVML